MDEIGVSDEGVEYEKRIEVQLKPDDTHPWMAPRKHTPSNLTALNLSTELFMSRHGHLLGLKLTANRLALSRPFFSDPSEQRYRPDWVRIATRERRATCSFVQLGARLEGSGSCSSQRTNFDVEGGFVTARSSVPLLALRIKQERCTLQR